MIEATHPPVQVRVASGSDAYTLFDVQAPAGAGVPPHIRARHRLTLLVLDGELEVACGEARHHLGPRDTISLPEDLACRIDALADARVLCLTIPADLEHLADLVSDRRVELDDIAALLAAAGICLLPPAWRPAHQ